MRPLNRWASEGSWLVAQLVGFTLILPLATFYQVALYAKTIFSHVSVTKFAFSIDSHLSMTRKGRVVRLLLIWFTIAELLSLLK